MKLLVTGVCGFVGSAVTAALLDHATPGQLEVVGIDNLSRPGSSLNRDKLVRRGVTVLHGDIRNASDLESVGAVDWVLDAAANPSVLAGVDGKSSSRQLVEHNLLGTVNLLEFCKRVRAGFILLSTSRVYSIPPLARLPVVALDHAYQPPDDLDWPAGLTERGISESFSTNSPVSLYGATKLASEQLALEYGNSFGFPVWINRCGVLAGATQFGKPDQGIFAFWLHSWREQRPLKYIGFGGHGYQVRDCLHPRDLVPLIRQQFNSCDSNLPQIVNVSGGRASARSLAQLSTWCKSRWGNQAVGHDRADRPFDLPWVVLDHSLATKTWGWKPSISVEEILAEIAEFADQHPDWISTSK